MHKGDEQGEYTFTGGKENTVIDYIVGEIKVWNKIEEMRVGDKVSDHLPIEVRIKRREGRKEEKGKRGWRGIWNEKGRDMFRQEVGKVELGGKEMEKEWEVMEEKVKKDNKRDGGS